MHFCLLQRASASKGSGHHRRTQEYWFTTSDKNKHLWPLQWSSGHCYSTRQRPGPDKSGHGCLLCLPEGQSSFYLFIFGLLEKDIRVGEEKKKEVSSRRHYFHIPSIKLFFEGNILFFRPHGCSGADPIPWLQGAI